VLKFGLSIWRAENRHLPTFGMVCDELTYLFCRQLALAQKLHLTGGMSSGK